MSPYEKLRAEKMQCNREKLRKLGLLRSSSGKTEEEDDNRIVKMLSSNNGNDNDDHGNWDSIQSDAISDSSSSAVDDGDEAATAVHNSTGSYVARKMSPYEKLRAEKITYIVTRLITVGKM